MRNGTCSRGEFPQPRAVRASRLARVSALAAKIAHVARHRFPLAIIRHAVWVYGGRARSLAACSAAELHQQPGPEPAAQQAFGSHQSPLYLEAKDWGCPSANHRVSDERRECANTGRSPDGLANGPNRPIADLADQPGTCGEAHKAAVRGPRQRRQMGHSGADTARVSTSSELPPKPVGTTSSGAALVRSLASDPHDLKRRLVRANSCMLASISGASGVPETACGSLSR